jgi:glycosyltransferase involved in cell wall biosynthesis
MKMIFGKGIIYNRFIDYELQSNYCIVAGNINDSNIIDNNELYHEESLIQEILINNLNKTIIYFSSCSIADEDKQDTPYVLHKIRVEEIIKKSGNNFYIFRLPQIIGNDENDKGVLRYLIESILNNQKFKLWKNAKRNFIDVDDIHDIVKEIIKQKSLINKTINIASPKNTEILELVSKIEKFTKCKANFEVVEKGSEYLIDITDINPILMELNINFNDEYLIKRIQKYYQYLLNKREYISVIVPTYNEENGIREFYNRTKYVMESLRPRFEYEIIFINDYSTDNTLSVISLLAEEDSNVKIINLSRNFGNQIAITAGIDYSKGDLSIIIDDDLQDPPEVIINLISKWSRGYKVVYGVRPERAGVSSLFNLVARLYYRIIGKLSDIKIPVDTGDFRLIDREVMNYLKEFKEESRYYRGLVSWVGFPQVGVLYKRDIRFAGVSTFSFKKYLNFAINGLTSFSEKPLLFSSFSGLIITLISFLLGLFLILYKLYDPNFSIQGWTSLILISLFFGGIQLLSIGIVGIYIGKIYRQVKGRPLYIIENTINIDK